MLTFTEYFLKIERKTIMKKINNSRWYFYFTFFSPSGAGGGVY